ncbi:MAG: FAD-dependent oxidoreductase [Nevskiaceae bacterium]|nr:MAG: FAD-dependent oxidoreductase [Nevskiaceae bacterium]TBR71356.1 MAG: FAD-dependent oxidoreductase [Nevskiaceae bacterium]
MNRQSAVDHSDVLVLGGGVIGLSSALELLRAGRSVRVLEKNTVGAGASHGNCGTITPHLLPLAAPGTVAKGLRWLLKPDAPLRIAPKPDLALIRWLLAFSGHCNEREFRRAARVKTRLLLASRALLPELIAREKLDCEFVENGHLIAFRNPALLAKEAPTVALWRELGVHVEELDGAACRALEPALNDSIVGGWHHPDEAHLRPDRYVNELARAVRAHGGIITEHVQVTACERGGTHLQSVTTGVGRFTADTLVMALGAWTPGLGRQLGLRLPIQAGKGYSITYSRPENPPQLPLILEERSVCVSTWGSGYRLGSTMEFAGFDTTLNRRRLDALVRAAKEYLREPLGPGEEERWYGWRPMTPDDLPVIGRAPGIDNLVIATGHGMVGISLSAITGQLVSEIVCGKVPSIDLAPFSPQRFG